MSATKIYAAFEDGEIVVWDLHTKEIVSSLDLHKSTVASIALSEDEVRMISGGFDGHIIIWDMLSEEHQIMYCSSFIQQICPQQRDHPSRIPQRHLQGKTNKRHRLNCQRRLSEGLGCLNKALHLSDFDPNN